MLPGKGSRREAPERSAFVPAAAEKAPSQRGLSAKLTEGVSVPNPHAFFPALASPRPRRGGLAFPLGKVADGEVMPQGRQKLLHRLPCVGPKEFMI